MKLRLTGTRPMLMHNGRLANPLDPYVRELKKVTGKRKKTDEDHAAILELEARASVYETDGLLALPTDNVWRSIYDAATAYRLGADVKRALIPISDVVPLIVAGAEVKVDDFLRDPDHVDYRSVVVQRNRTMRARPLIPEGWVCVHEFDLFDDILQIESLEPVLTRAGRVVGVGDYRPRYGTFTAEIVE